MKIKKLHKYFSFVLIFIVAVLTSNITALALDATTSEFDTGGGFPTHISQSMQANGDAKIAVFMVEFADIANTDPSITPESLHNHLFVNTPTEDNPYGSLTKYYQTSSNGRLNLSGEVFGWYKAKNKRSYYNTDERKEKLISSMINHYTKMGVDFSIFDLDNNHSIDGVYLLFAGGSDNVFYDYTKSSNIDIKNINKTIYSYSLISSTKLSKFIHETGHQLGMTDYYYNENGANYYGMGGLDMMDGMIGDHNAFTKLLLGWVSPLPITPNMISPNGTNVSITPTTYNNDAIVIFPTDKVNYYGKYYVIEYIKPEKLWDFSTAKNTFSDGALRIIEVNATVSSNYDSFMQPIKNIVTIVEADNDNSLSNKSNSLLSPKDLFIKSDDTTTLKLTNKLSLTISDLNINDNLANFNINIIDTTSKK